MPTMEPEKAIAKLCWYNRHVECEDMHKCRICGWNPHQKKLREQRIEKLKERMAAK